MGSTAFKGSSLYWTASHNHVGFLIQENRVSLFVNVASHERDFSDRIDRVLQENGMHSVHGAKGDLEEVFIGFALIHFM